MQVSFPELTDLWLSSHVETLSVIPVPDSFLGGSAPRLRYFSLSGIPRSGYISPEAMVTSLSMLTGLETPYLEFRVDMRSARPDVWTWKVSLLRVLAFW